MRAAGETARDRDAETRWSGGRGITRDDRPGHCPPPSETGMIPTTPGDQTEAEKARAIQAGGRIFAGCGGYFWPFGAGGILTVGVALPRLGARGRRLPALRPRLASGPLGTCRLAVSRALSYSESRYRCFALDLGIVHWYPRACRPPGLRGGNGSRCGRVRAPGFARLGIQGAAVVRRRPNGEGGNEVCTAWLTPAAVCEVAGTAWL